jgi:intracellular multiplication protein IcmL
MQNSRHAISRRLSDPDFQGRLVNRLLAVAVALAVAVIAQAVLNYYLLLAQPQPKYFFVDGKFLPRPAVALDSPIVDDTELREWATQALLAAYNVNYHDYPEQLNMASRRFTVSGWNTFAESYIKSGNYDKMKTASLLCYASAQRAAVIRQSLMIEGALAYEIQLQIVQTCQNTNQQSTQNLILTARIVRTNSQDHPDGLAIVQLVAVPQ